MSFNPELCRNESEVESKLIVQYLLPQLGYSPHEWYQEVAFGSIRLDFLAFATQFTPGLNPNFPFSIILEAKHPNQNLDKHSRRLKHYLNSLNVKYGLLTNGKEIRIYENVNNNIQLMFQCEGKNINTEIDNIKAFISKNVLIKKIKSLSNFQDYQLNKQLIQISNANVKINTSQVKSQHTQIINGSAQDENTFEQIEQELNRLEQLYNLNPETQKQNTMKTIAIYHNKGGVGKTTVAVNLAAALSQKGKRVLLIDIDSQANTTFATGLLKFQFEEDDDLKDRNVYHLLKSGELDFIPDIVRKSQHFNNPELDVIPSHITLIDGQSTLNKIAAAKSRLITKLKRVETNYDIVIIDTPPSRDYYAEVALITADYLIIPSDLKPFANQGLPTVIDFIKEVNEYKELIGKQPIKLLGVLASKISTNSKFLQYTFPKQRDVILERYNLQLMETVIYDRTALSECMNQVIHTDDLEYPDPKSIIKYAELKTSAQMSAEEFDILAMEVLQKIVG